MKDNITAAEKFNNATVIVRECEKLGCFMGATPAIELIEGNEKLILGLIAQVIKIGSTGIPVVKTLKKEKLVESKEQIKQLNFFQRMIYKPNNIDISPNVPTKVKWDLWKSFIGRFLPKISEDNNNDIKPVESHKSLNEKIQKSSNNEAKGMIQKTAFGYDNERYINVQSSRVLKDSFLFEDMHVKLDKFYDEKTNWKYKKAYKNYENVSASKQHVLKNNQEDPLIKEIKQKSIISD